MIQVLLQTHHHLYLAFPIISSVPSELFIHNPTKPCSTILEIKLPSKFYVSNNHSFILELEGETAS